jgi:hypothetical protein
VTYMRSLVEEVTTRFSRSETVLPYASIEAQERSATVLQLYCNRTDMYWYRIEKATPQDYRKSPKKARFPYASGRARTCASKLVMRLGQRFESARRLSFLPAKLVKKALGSLVGGFGSSRLSQSLIPCVGVSQMAAGHSRWRSPILWYGPFDRCAWVFGGCGIVEKAPPQ